MNTRTASNYPQPADKEIEFYIAKVPYAFNVVSVGADMQIFSKTVGPKRQHQRRISKQHTDMHHHDYFELVYVVSGGITQIIEGEEISYLAGEGCILNRNVNHCEIYKESSKILFMMLTEEFLSPLVDETFIYSTSNIFHNTFDSICHLIRQNKEYKYYTAKEYISFTSLLQGSEYQALLVSMEELTHNLVNTTINHYPGNEFIIAGLVSRFFSILENEEKYHKEIFHLIGSSTEKLVNQITRIFEEHKGKVSRNELESLLHYNADYLNRVLKKSTGFTLVEYRQLFMLQEAAILLQQTNMNVTQIMSQLGFSNRTHFNKIFIAKYGMSPSQYKEKTSSP